MAGPSPVKHEIVTIIEPTDFFNFALFADTYEGVVEEIEQMWVDYDLRNDTVYMKWDKGMAEDYPQLGAYVDSSGITGKILIHYWW